jgi:hypothetical protein
MSPLAVLVGEIPVAGVVAAAPGQQRPQLNAEYYQIVVTSNVMALRAAPRPGNASALKPAGY